MTTAAICIFMTAINVWFTVTHPATAVFSWGAAAVCAAIGVYAWRTR